MEEKRDKENETFTEPSLQWSINDLSCTRNKTIWGGNKVGNRGVSLPGIQSMKPLTPVLSSKLHDLVKTGFTTLRMNCS